MKDNAYLYFLPRLLKHLLEDPIHKDLLTSRLKSLDKKNLSPDDTAIIEKIIILKSNFFFVFLFLAFLLILAHLHSMMLA